MFLKLILFAAALSTKFAFDLYRLFICSKEKGKDAYVLLNRPPPNVSRNFCPGPNDSKIPNIFVLYVLRNPDEKTMLINVETIASEGKLEKFKGCQESEQYESFGDKDFLQAYASCYKQAKNKLNDIEKKVNSILADNKTAKFLQSQKLANLSNQGSSYPNIDNEIVENIRTLQDALLPVANLLGFINFDESSLKEAKSKCPAKLNPDTLINDIKNGHDELLSRFKVLDDTYLFDFKLPPSAIKKPGIRALI